MQIIKKVLIKQVVTEKSKEKLRFSFNDHRMRLEQECQQLRFEQRKLENKKSMSKQELSQRFQQEIKNRKEKIKLVEFKIEQLDILEIGSEITEKEVEALVEVSEGMHWDEIMEESAIVIKDDVVVRIDK
ncbi:YlqD protein [Lentibacillus persicus]|uniref:YlqD protein n=1 Tax=Lentibacillus persicus TaxID=640948 RepID=A0A1I1VDX8_9BACI|nr:YlqD family protein [Lentibacillus persicus]SFD81187.1 YlqD protein [Lentibacillus persicus]